MSDVKGTIEASKAQLTDIIEMTAVGYHEQVYVNVDDGRLRFLAGTPGGTVVAFNDFVEGEIENIEGDDLDAIIPVPELLDYVGLATEGTSGTLKLEFVKSDEAALAEQLRISTPGSHSFEVGLTLPASESAMENVPTTLPQMFNDENVLLNKQEDRPVTTTINTYIESLETITEVVGLREELEFYPIVVKDENFVLDVGTESGNYVDTHLQGEVDGDDVENLYGSGFSEIVKKLDGQVTLHCEQGSPLMVLKELSHGTLRHVLGAAQ